MQNCIHYMHFWLRMKLSNERIASDALMEVLYFVCSNLSSLLTQLTRFCNLCKKKKLYATFYHLLFAICYLLLDSF